MGRNLDRLGKNLVGGIMPDRGPNARQPAPAASIPVQDRGQTPATPARPGALSNRSNQGNASVYQASPRAPAGTASSPKGATSSSAHAPARASQAADPPRGTNTERSAPLGRPLHERLTALRSSAFEEAEGAGAADPSDAQAPPEYVRPQAGGVVSQPDLQTTPGIPGRQRPTYPGLGPGAGVSGRLGTGPGAGGAPATAGAPAVGAAGLGQATGATGGGSGGPTGGPVVRTAPGLSEALRRPEAVGPWGRIVPGAVPSAASGQVGNEVPSRGPVGEPTAPQQAIQGTQDPQLPGPPAQASHREDLLIAGKGPTVSVQTIGPRSITVGRESGYELRVRNSGQTGAEELVVLVDLPAWTEVVGAEASTGATRLGTAGDPSHPFQWEVGRLPAGGEERLVLRIIPRQSRPFELAVRWDYRSAATQAAIEVCEPKLVLNLDGPREVLYGKTALYRLEISNPGTGDAENVLIRLMPLGPGEREPAEHRLGRLPVGEHRTVEVELTARQTGDLALQVQAEAEGGVKAEAAAQVLVRRPALAVEVVGPKVLYVGATAGYHVTLSNPGTAGAEDVQLLLELPPGVRYVSGIEAQRLEDIGQKLVWSLGSLPAGVEKTFDVQCRLETAGQSRIGVVAAAQDELSAAAETTTTVEAMADLVLEVSDPTGPVPVGQEAVYELRVRNRGTEKAEGVEVRAYFSRGVEPIAAEGGQHQLGPGQVMFRPIPSVAAGAELVLRVRARADVPGNHVLRAEVHCQRPTTRLASEEATYFYQQTATGLAQPQAGPEGSEVSERPGGAASPDAGPAPPWAPDDRAGPTAAVPAEGGAEIPLPRR